MTDSGGYDSDKSKLSKLVDALKTLINDNLWDASFLLKRKKKDLVSQIEALEHVLSDTDQESSADGVVESSTVPEGQVALYISLFQKEGDRLLNWELAIAALPGRSGGRPIYQSESEVRQWISSRGSSVNEGFVRVVVDKNDILPTTRVDALGQPLVGIKERVLHLDAIDEFVHFNEVTYQVVQGKLIKQL